MPKEQTQDQRRASVKISVDKIRRYLSVIDINTNTHANEQDLAEAREACCDIGGEHSKLTALVRGLA